MYYSRAYYVDPKYKLCGRAHWAFTLKNDITKPYGDHINIDLCKSW